MIVCVLVLGHIFAPATFGEENPVLWSLRHLACYGGGALVGACLLGERPAALGFQLPEPSRWWLVVAGGASGLLLGALAGCLGSAGGYGAHGRLWADNPAAATIAFVLAHASQELFFRGYILVDDSRRGSSPTARGAAIQSLLGIATHWDKGWVEAFGAAPAAVVLSFLRLRTGSLLSPFLAHILAALSANLVAAGLWKPA